MGLKLLMSLLLRIWYFENLNTRANKTVLFTNLHGPSRQVYVLELFETRLLKQEQGLFATPKIVVGTRLWEFLLFVKCKQNVGRILYRFTHIPTYKHCAALYVLEDIKKTVSIVYF